MSAYVAGASGLPAGSFEFSVKAEWMGGLSGPETKPETQQTVVPSVNLYEIGVGYSFGTVAVFQDIKLKMTGMYYGSAEEILGGTSIYPRDEGGVLGFELGANFVHDPNKLFGIFIRSQNPIEMDIGKFVNPKIDRFGIGFQSANKFNESFGQETLIYIGGGISGNGFKQNASLSASISGVVILEGGLFEHGLALRLGPFFDGDLGERSDLAYGTQGVRAFRLGIAASATYSITPSLILDLAYVQKVTGAYFRATKDFSIGMRVIF